MCPRSRSSGNSMGADTRCLGEQPSGITSGLERWNPMMRVELNTVVARPIEDVFGRLTDLSDYSRWIAKARNLRQVRPDFGGSRGHRDHLLRQGSDGHL